MKTKHINILVFLLVSFNVSAQDTLSYYVTKDGKEVTKDKADELRKVIATSEETYLVKDYYLNGQLQMIGTYLSKDLKKKTGLWKKWYENGQLKEEGNYIKSKNNGTWLKYYKNAQLKSSIEFIEGVYHGNLITYWDNGTKKRDDKFINGNFVEGRCFDSNGLEIEHFEYMLMPEFPGGIKALFKFLGQNVKYPPNAKSKGIQGKVYVSFTVSKDGELIDVKIIRGVHELLDSEALRVVNSMQKWSPGKRDGELVPVTYNLPINFFLRGESFDSQNPRALKNFEKGERFFKEEEYQKAIIHFTESLKWETKNQTTYFNRALSYAKLNNMEKACLDWEKAVELGYEKAQSYIDNYCK